MPFEYDPRKSDANRKKHGIDFEEAQELWDDEAFMKSPPKIWMSRVFWSLEKSKENIGRL